jgi:hypothetical protein
MTDNVLPSSNAGASSSDDLIFLAVGGPTVVLEIGGLRLVTDPTFDEPGTYPGRQEDKRSPRSSLVR